MGGRWNASSRLSYKKKKLWIHLVVSLSQTSSHVLSCHLERLTWKGTDISSHQLPGAESAHGAILIAQLVKNPPAMQKTLVQFLGQEDPLEKG